MTARDKGMQVKERLERRGIAITLDEAQTLRRAEMTLHRWAELECGDGNGCIERDEKTGIPYYRNANRSYVDPRDPRATRRIADREKGALTRVAAICDKHSLYYFHQTDPRGCALYVSREPLTDSAYTNGIAICN